MEDKYIIFIADSISFDMYDLHSEEERFCMTYYETQEAVENNIPKIVTPSLASLRYWDKYLDVGYRTYIIKNNKKVEITVGMKSQNGHLRKICSPEVAFLRGHLDEYFK